MTEIKLQYGIGVRVRVKELDRRGVVIAVLLDRYGTRYDVRYFDKAEAREVYFFEDELEPIAE